MDESKRRSPVSRKGNQDVHGLVPILDGKFSNLVHYVRSDDFVQELLLQSRDADEYAFALGALAHTPPISPAIQRSTHPFPFNIPSCEPSAANPSGTHRTTPRTRRRYLDSTWSKWQRIVMRRSNTAISSDSGSRSRCWSEPSRGVFCKQTSNVSSNVQTQRFDTSMMGFTRNLESDLRMRRKRSKYRFLVRLELQCFGRFSRC
jgi:hypothetical protein